MILAQATDIGDQLTDVLGDVVAFLPKLVAFLLILVIGYFIAKAIAKAIGAVLERVGFDKYVERGGIRKALSKSQYDASDIMGKIVFYAVMLFVLQLAFGVFGPNPISELIQGVIAFLPKLFVAILIIVIASAIAAAAREIISASLGGLSYGNTLANIAGIAIISIGIFAALNQVEIAPEIVNGLFYAILAIIAGSAIVAIGGSGIIPLRSYWEDALDKVDEESGRIVEEAKGSGDAIEARFEQRKAEADPNRPAPAMSDAAIPPVGSEPRTGQADPNPPAPPAVRTDDLPPVGSEPRTGQADPNPPAPPAVRNDNLPPRGTEQR